MTQDTALTVLKTGANVFLTGAPGSGKTHTLNQYIDYLHRCNIPVAITASTGIAATHIGGMTIHAWSGVGIRKSLTANDLDEMGTRENLVKRVRAAKVLVIDEISMLAAGVLEAIDTALRSLRNSTEPFGGLQIIMVGDFFQLPPIPERGQVAHFAFEANAWSAANLLVCYLTDQYRHEDETLLSILNAIRNGSEDEEIFAPLLERVNGILEQTVEATKLYTHNSDVDRINDTKLLELKGSIERFWMTGKGNPRLIETLKANCISPEELVLKIGAVVIATKNNFDAGFVNGSLGVVVDFDTESRYPIIETPKGVRLTIEPMEWSVEDSGKVLASIAQIPLRLAWAITVHKSQGMTLDAAVIDLSKTFEYGQGYVALSRVRTLKGMSLLGINPRAFQVHPSIVVKDGEFRSLAHATEETFSLIPPEELSKMHEQCVIAFGGTIPKPGSEGEARRGRAHARALANPALPGATFTETLTLFRTGKSIAEIAKARNLAWSTIMGHVEKLAEKNLLIETDIPSLYALVSLTEDAHGEIKNAFTALETTKLTPVFEYCKEKYSYETLHIVRILIKLAASGGK